jgi:hypothetical protein
MYSDFDDTLSNGNVDTDKERRETARRALGSLSRGTS